MVWLSVRTLRAYPGRALLISTGVVIGIALVSGTRILVDTANRTDGASGAIGGLDDVVLLAGGVALLVGGFIINSSFAVTLAQRTRELALLRCLGADRRQVRRMVGAEALMVGVVGSLVGLALGAMVAAGLRALINSDLLSGTLPGQGLAVTPATVAISLLLGSLVVVVSALLPARRAGRAAPLAALNDRPTAASRRRAGARLVVGATLTAVGVVAVPVAALTGIGPLLLVAGASTLVGVRLVGPWLIVPLARLVGAPLVRGNRLSGWLGRDNAIRNPDRTAATAAALMIGLALASFVTVLATSTKAFIEAEARRTPDLRIQSAGGGTGPPAPIGPEVVRRLTALPELASVVTITGTEGRAFGEVAGVVGIDPTTYFQVQGVVVVTGRVDDLGPGGVAVSERAATTHGWRVGSPVSIALPGGTRSFTVRTIHRNGYYIPGPPEYLLDASDYAALGGEPGPFEIIIRIADGVDPAAARGAVERALAGSALVLEDREQMRRRALGQIDTVASVYLALTGLSALIGLFGIVNTICLSIVDRVRELGLLRAIGMGRRQVRSMVRVEAIIIAMVGALLGIAVGLLFGWGAATVFNDSSAPTLFTVPAGPLGLMALVAVVVGVAAAVLPGRLASRVDILRAIAAE